MATINGTADQDFIHKAGDGHFGYGTEIPTATDGPDTINGLGGDDTIYPGFGNDIISGGSGNDTIYVNDSDTASGGFGNDTFTTTWTVGHIGTVTLNGDAGHDTFNITFVGPLTQSVSATGGLGLDTFNVDGHGPTTLDGGDGDDTFVLTKVANITLTLGAGVDWVTLAALQDTHPVVTINDFQAGDGGDVLHLDLYLDSVLAGWDHKTNPFGIDLLRLTSAASDTVVQVNISGVWYDLIVLKNTAADDLVAANLSGFPPDGSPPPVTTTFGETKESSLLNYPDDHHFTITGLGGPDIIYAGTFNETIYGGAGDDQLYGRPYTWPFTDQIVLDGGSGDDLLVHAPVMTGGQGSDTFVFQQGDQSLYITDFTPGVDQLVLYGYAEVLQIQAGANATIIYVRDGMIVLDDVDAATLTPDDIVFDPAPLLAPPPAIPTPTGSPITTPLLTPTYTLGVGESAWFDGNGYVLFVEPPLNAVDGIATIAGTITKTLSGDGGSSVFDGYHALDVTVTPTGVVYLDVTRDGASYDYAFFAFANEIHLNNQGAITLISDQLNVTGTHDGAGTIVNSGSIYIWAGQKAVGVDSNNGGDVDNQAGGVIEVEGQNGAIGVSLSSVGAGHGSFNNAGTISAASGSTINASMAVYLGALPYSFVNSGILEGDYSLYVADTVSYLYPGEVIGPYVNSGQMYGVVRLSFDDDTLQNSGLIDGTIYLGLGNDVYQGSGGTQDGGVYGGDGDDTLTGGAGTEYMFGGEGNDGINGGGGDDFIDGGRGTNTLDGGAGNDTLSFGSSDVGVVVNLLTNTFVAPGAAGTIVNFENVSGSIFDDTLTGTGAANTLTGGKGDDSLTGGAGDDTFKFVIGDGDDVITDFAAGGAQDSLQIYGYGGYQSLTQVGADTRVVLSATDSILLKNVLVGSLAAQDFSFSVTLPSSVPASPLIPGSDTIRVTADYTVAAGETMTFNRPDCAFLLNDTQEAFALTNYGDVSITAHGNVAGVEATQDFSRPFTNGLGASFKVTNLGPIGTAYGIYMLDLWGVHLVNSGEFAVLSTADAYGVKAPYSGHSITNLGEFTVQADGAAFGAMFNNGGSASNSGDFEVHGGTAATGVQINGYGNSGFINTGTFTVIVDDPDVASVAVRLSYDPNNDSISNGGTITADKAFLIDAYSSQLNEILTINNSGVINGDIEIAGISITIHNTNTINGNVSLDVRNDTFDGSTGTLNGVIDGGDGNDVLSTGAGNTSLIGGPGNDQLNAGAGNDWLDGGLGDDILNGGSGFDVAAFVSAPSPVIADLSIVGVQNTLGAGFDQLIGIEYLIGSNYGDILRGDGVHNVLLWGGLGNDQIQSGPGDDYLVGGPGFDAVSYGNASAAVSVDLSITGIQNTGGAGSDQLLEMEYLLGSAYGDSLKGDGVHNVLLSGAAGNDLLFSGAGSDYLIGGAGFDVASYAYALAPVMVDLSLIGIQNTLGAGSDQLAEIEYVIGSDFGDIIRGDGVHNVLLWGGLGNDQIQGGAGSDYLVGGPGFDAVSYGNATAGVNVDLSITGVQNTGGAGSDTLAEMEYLLGSNFNDVLKGDGVHNVLLSGGSGNDGLQGGAGADYLLGGVGTDTLTGGAGADTLVGGTGADSFIFASVSDFAPGPSWDVITDFSAAQTDKINLAGIDANTATSGNQAFSFLGTAAFGNVAGQLRYSANGSGGVNVEGDTDGNGVADFKLVLDSTVSLTATDFIL